MDVTRQKAFQKLRPPCVELSSIALKFRGKQTSVKSVLHALEQLLYALQSVSKDDALDPKLAEYVFFPLSHVFNESQRLSSPCLEAATKALQILVSRGWRQKLLPEMGKQLLILMSLLAGGSPGNSQSEPPSDELKVTSFHCIATLSLWMGKSQPSQSVFGEVGAKTIVDQLVYLLLESITDSPSHAVQLSAVRALLQLQSQISDRVILASLLPRSTSALTKALQLTTKSKRSYKVLQANLELLTNILRGVLSDQAALPDTSTESVSRVLVKEKRGDHGDAAGVLDESWLTATSSKVKVALAGVVKLRNHDRLEVRQELLKLCVMVIQDCPETLAESVPLLIETTVILACCDDSTALSTLRSLAATNPAVQDQLNASLQGWSASLSRVMAGNDDRPKRQILGSLAIAYDTISGCGGSEYADQSLALNLTSSIAATLQAVKRNTTLVTIESLGRTPGSLQLADTIAFEPILLEHQSSEASTLALRSLISRIAASPRSSLLIQSIMSNIQSADILTRLAATWLCLRFLQTETMEGFIDNFIDFEQTSESAVASSRVFLVADLYSLTLPFLFDATESAGEGASSTDWRLSALALESLIAQANQLGPSYRPELIETLYPILSLLGSSHSGLQKHAMAALNLLAKVCEYTSTSAMLVENVDYLVNKIALKLNTFDISLQAPQILLMMVRLCGASLIPYLDDLIDNIFAALDNFHGYPNLVEVLFEVLSAVVDEASKDAKGRIADGREIPIHRKGATRPSTTLDILADLQAQKQRVEKTKAESEGKLNSAPQRPWKSELIAPLDEGETSNSEDESDTNLSENDEEAPLPPPSEEKRPLSKTYNLLLSIAQATAPHLSSPSPSVRLILLKLLTRIGPLLSRDENTFLPLINSVWPAVVPRLFGYEDGEAAYVVCAAAETIAALCEGAGDFMSSRIEDIWGKLEGMLRKVSVGGKGRSRPGAAVDLRIVSHIEGQAELHSQTVRARTPAYGTSGPPDAQIQSALVSLSTSILNHVRITDDQGDTLLELLATFADGRNLEIREALETWNADAVWVQQVAVAPKEKPDLPPSLVGRGWQLR